MSGARRPRLSAARTRSGLALATSLAALLCLGAVALAEEPIRLEGPVTDTTGLLDGRHEEIDSALADLRSRAGIQLFVLFVRTTDPLPADDYAFEVAELNSMGVDDALLLVALDDRTDYIWLSEQLDEVSDDELNAVISDRLEPNLGEGDFVGAVIDAADGLADAATTSPPGAGSSLVPLLGLLLLAVGVFLVIRWLIAWRARRGEAEERDRRTGELAKRANQLLLQADDATSDAQQELGFAEAEFTQQEVQPLRDAAAQARAETTAAFAIRQQLDDSTPEDPVAREKMLNEVVARAQRALDLLARQRERVAEIRAIERAAPEILGALPARLEGLADAGPDAEARLDRLARFAEDTVAPVAGNLVEARKRLAAAREGVQAGTEALAAGDKQAAGRHARLAQAATTEAEQLLAAVQRLEETVAATAARLATELGEAESSVSSARAALRSASPPLPEQSERLNRAEQALERARALAADVRPDPLAAERLATEADKLSDEVLAAAHQEAERRARAAATAQGALAAAEAAYMQALDFVTSRRSAMGRRARTRLVEAERHLAEARVLVDSDPLAAAQAAHRAEALAHEALSYGQDDLQRLDPYAGRSGGGGGSELPSMIPWILGSILSGGGRGGSSGAGWGGSPWGRTGGGFGGGRGGRGGGFGGFGGGRGGGRGAGGRW